MMMAPRNLLSFLACFLMFNAVGITGMRHFQTGFGFNRQSFSPRTSFGDIVNRRSSAFGNIRNNRRTTISGSSRAELENIIRNLMNTRGGGRGGMQYTVNRRIRQPISVNSHQNFIRQPSSQRRGQGIGRRLRGPTQFGLDQDHVKFILDYHNDVRRGVDREAADMLHMHWDTRLAQRAFEWIQNCKMEHQGTGSVGENLAWLQGFGQDIDAVVKSGLEMWADEKKFYRYGDRFSQRTGHYTQMIWAATRNVGCAAQECAGANFYFFCFYSPPGNVRGQLPYTQGNKCSLCNSCRNGLCD